jgi:hypothetical protein
VLPNGNRYEGDWENDAKHGDGKFFYLDKGQLLSGTWVNGTGKCGEFIDLQRQNAVGDINGDVNGDSALSPLCAQLPLMTVVPRARARLCKMAPSPKRGGVPIRHCHGRCRSHHVYDC